MNIELQHIALMEWMGYRRKTANSTIYDLMCPWIHPDGYDIPQLPELTLDLLHEAEKLIENNGDLSWGYMDELGKITLPDVTGWWALRATKEQRLEALLRTLNLWREV